MRTLFLMPNTWDLALDINGNIASATAIYQQAQDVASECRVITGDMYYDKKRGIPYLTEILGKGRYSLALYRQQLQDAAVKVPGVISAVADFKMCEYRAIGGQIRFNNSDGESGVIYL